MHTKKQNERQKVILVYLDTDCILALVKDSDWLKEPVTKKIKREKKLSTSVLTVIECRLVLLRENTPEEAFRVEKVINKWKIKLIPLDEQVLKQAKKFMQEFDFLGTFDAVHIATADLNCETILSTDHVSSLIPNIEVVDPRD